MERYKQLARLAEILTVAALTTAVINIGLDVGRPDRFIINVVWYGRWHSPFVWSMTVSSTSTNAGAEWARPFLPACVLEPTHALWVMGLFSIQRAASDGAQKKVVILSRNGYTSRRKRGLSQQDRG